MRMGVENPRGLDLPGMGVVRRLDNLPPLPRRQHVFGQHRHPNVGKARSSSSPASMRAERVGPPGMAGEQDEIPQPLPVRAPRRCRWPAPQGSGGDAISVPGWSAVSGRRRKEWPGRRRSAGARPACGRPRQAWMVSVDRGRWGPCSSVEPKGMKTVRVFFRALARIRPWSFRDDHYRELLWKISNRRTAA